MCPYSVLQSIGLSAAGAPAIAASTGAYVAGNAVQGLAETNAVELEAHTASPPTLKDETTSEVPTLEAPTIKFPEQNEVIPEIQLPDNQMGMPDYRDSPPGSNRNSKAEAIETPADTPLAKSPKPSSVALGYSPSVRSAPASSKSSADKYDKWYHKFFDGICFLTLMNMILNIEVHTQHYHNLSLKLSLFAFEVSALCLQS